MPMYGSPVYIESHTQNHEPSGWISGAFAQYCQEILIFQATLEKLTEADSRQNIRDLIEKNDLPRACEALAGMNGQARRTPADYLNTLPHEHSQLTLDILSNDCRCRI